MIGPLLIRGPITIYDEDGSVLAGEPVSPLQICPRQPDEFVKRSANVYDASSDASS